MPRWAHCARAPLTRAPILSDPMAAPHRVQALPGGARLVLESMPERHSTSVVLMFAGGSRLEDDRLGGVSHFIEHLYFKGTRRRPTTEEIADAIEGVGGFINASTDKELTAYWTRVPAEHLQLGLDVLADIVSNSKLAPDDVERERMVILEELKMYQDQPQDYVLNLLEEVIWPEHPRAPRPGVRRAQLHAEAPRHRSPRGLPWRRPEEGGRGDQGGGRRNDRALRSRPVRRGASARQGVHQRAASPGSRDNQRGRLLAHLPGAPARRDKEHRRRAAPRRCRQRIRCAACRQLGAALADSNGGHRPVHQGVDFRDCDRVVVPRFSPPTWSRSPGSGAARR